VDKESRYIYHIFPFATDRASHLILLLASFAAQQALLMHAFPQGLLGYREWRLLTLG
jgi:hypothetical protein